MCPLFLGEVRSVSTTKSSGEAPPPHCPLSSPRGPWPTTCGPWTRRCGRLCATRCVLRSGHARRRCRGPGSRPRARPTAAGMPPRAPTPAQGPSEARLACFDPDLARPASRRGLVWCGCRPAPARPRRRPPLAPPGRSAQRWDGKLYPPVFGHRAHHVRREHVPHPRHAVDRRTVPLSAAPRLRDADCRCAGGICRIPAPAMPLRRRRGAERRAAQTWLWRPTTDMSQGTAPSTCRI